MTTPPPRPLRVALCGLGLAAYWPQFPGLKAELEGCLATVANLVAGPDIHLVPLGLVDSVSAAREAGSRCRREEVDLLLLYATTYTLSGTVLPLVSRAQVPVIVLNLQPQAAIDYAAFAQLPDRTAMTGAWLSYCSACPTPEIANLFARAGIAFHQVTGYLGEPHIAQQLSGWLAAARVAATLRQSTLGLMGHYYSGMFDIQTDLTRISTVFGVDVEMVEVEEINALRANLDESAIAARAAAFHTCFDIQPDCPPAELTRAAATSLALDQLVAAHDLSLMAYYAQGSGTPAHHDILSSIILGASLLTASHVPVAGEYEVKNAIAMKIMDILGAGGSFTEFYAMDFAAGQVLMGHDGPGHTAIAQGKTKVRPLGVYHGKVGNGLSVEMSVLHGPVTLLSVAEDPAHGFKLLVAEGRSEPGPILEIGNTNSRYSFPLGARGFVEAWNAQAPAHHCAIGIGHRAADLRKLAALLRIPFVQIC